MIMVALPSKPFVYTAKMTTRRQAIIKDYEAEINTLYTEIEESSQVDLAAPAEWSPFETLDFVRQAVALTLKGSASDDADLFQCGCDRCVDVVPFTTPSPVKTDLERLPGKMISGVRCSLQATWIRNSILRALRDSVPEVAKRLPTSFVYDYPTINQMTSYICRAVLNPHLDQRVDLATRGAELQAIVDKYTSDFPAHSPASGFSAPPGEVYFVTGTTGGLGSNTLAQLLEKESVVKVYAFNRPARGASSLERHREAFVKRGLDVKLLESGKVVFVEGELSEPMFGTSEESYEEIKTSVTHIVHSGTSKSDEHVRLEILICVMHSVAHQPEHVAYVV